LYFYRQEKVTLPKGGRARYVLLEGRVPYEHIYQWDIPEENTNDSNRYDESRPVGRENEVWHTIRLKNSGSQPWTTAPAMMVKGGLPLAQDTLAYTPPGASTNVRLTVAPDIKAEQRLTEISRQEVNVLGHTYYQVEVEAVLKLRNGQARPAKMCVRKTVSGQVKDAPGGGMTRTAGSLTSLNPRHEVKWEFDLPAASDHELKMRYSVVVSR